MKGEGGREERGGKGGGREGRKEGGILYVKRSTRLLALFSSVLLDSTYFMKIREE